jgi:hypothetical protein
MREYSEPISFTEYTGRTFTTYIDDFPIMPGEEVS